MASATNAAESEVEDQLEFFARILSAKMKTLRARVFKPESRKTLRRFSSGEVARMLGVSDGHLRQMSLDGIGPAPEVTSNGRRSYGLDQVNELRRYFATTRPKNALELLPHRRPGEPLQVVAVASFKGGSGKTTTAIHLAQYLALRGYRVLAMDLDPQGSMTAMFGLQPESDLNDGDSLYGVIRYGEARRPMRDVVRETYFPGISLVPGAIELQEWEHEVPAAMQQRSAEPFYRRVSGALAEVADHFDVVVIDCPPQLGFLTLTALTTCTGMLVPIHPQMLDVLSLSQFMTMASDLMSVVTGRGAKLQREWIRFINTRHDPFSTSEVQVVGMLRGMFGDSVLAATALMSAAVTNAGLFRKTIYEADRSEGSRQVHDRAVESMDAVNAEIERLFKVSWGRS